MWIANLPDPQKNIPTKQAPSFPENILFTEKLDRKYNYPELVCSFGLISVLSGRGIFGINGKQETLGKEKFLIVNSNSRLSIRIAQTETNPALLFFKSKLPEIIAASLSQSTEQLLDRPECDQRNLDFSLLEKLHNMDETLKNKLLLLHELGGSSSSFAALKSDNIVRSILEQVIVRNNLANCEALNLLVKKKSTRIELYKRLYSTKDWIDENYHQSIGLNEMAAVACMNSQHFLRSFKQLFDITPHQYLINVRLDNSKKMLLSTDETIQMICMNAGMESVSSFSWLFKKRFGLNPSEFRE